MEETVYYSLLGELEEYARLPWVENAFSKGKPCDRAYSDILAAYGRICARLESAEEDADLEIIMNSFLEIQQALCMKMFFYGQCIGRLEK